MKVKICGITNLDDALYARDAGADFLGFIFYPPSKRSIDPAQARDISAVLHADPKCPALVGVFVNETAETILQTLVKCHLDLAQLSGEEVPYLIADKRSPLYGRSYKALRPSSISEAEAEAEWYAVPEWNPWQPNLLIDTHHPTLRGGTGQTGDWALSARLAEDVPGLMLAGGLNAANVAEAIAQVRPYAVDVASGVEAYPGKKDPELVRKFINQARSAG